MPNITIECPSGFAGEIRGLKIREMNLMASQKALRDGDIFDRLLKTCFVRVTDNGPYAGIPGALVAPKRPEGEAPAALLPDWSKILIADRFYALLQIRRATFGPIYAFGLNCPRCKKKFEWEIDTATQLPVKPLPQASRDRLAQGKNEFDVKMDLAGVLRTVRFKLQDGAGERAAADKAEKYKDRLMTIAVASRILGIEGVEPSGIHNFIDDLDLQEAQDLLAAFEDVDGGIRTLISVVCTRCNAESEVQLPFGVEFFMPSSKASPTTAKEESTPTS